MHEFGHALTAKKFGVVTKDVIISPIGGVARLKSIPKNPKQELLIALAGPAVNLGLAIFFGLIQFFSFDNILPKGDRINLIDAPQDYIAYLLLINVALIGFNMIPAFPMDGGRVLRALLSMWLKNRLKATKIASIIGQLFAVLFLVVGYYSGQNFMLIFIGIFVFVMARAEYKQISTEHLLSSTLIMDIMDPDFTKIYKTDHIQRVFELGENRSYLVFDQSDNLCGALPDLFINDAKSRGEMETKVEQYTSQSYGLINQTMSVLTAFQAMNNYGWSVVGVLDEQRNIIGIADRYNINQFMRKA